MSREMHVFREVGRRARETVKGGMAHAEESERLLTSLFDPLDALDSSF